MLDREHRSERASSSDSIWSDDRGQTLQDYLLGVSLFLLTVFLVVGTILPTVTAPFDQQVGGDKISQADRVAETIVSNTSVATGGNRLDVTLVENIVDADGESLRDRFRIPETSWLNVSVVTLDAADVHRSANGTALASDATPEQRATATSARIVTLDDDSCDTACRLVVRVW